MDTQEDVPDVDELCEAFSSLGEVSGLDRFAAGIRLSRRPETRIAFCGHFNSGKSTLLNKLIGRPLLPTYDLPETGAACWLRHASVEQANWCEGDGTKVPLEVSSAGIGRFTTLLGLDGLRRENSGAGHVEIGIPCRALEGDIAWIDTPGINDEGTMTEIVYDVANDADVVVFVLNSKQCLSLIEVEFVKEIVAANGPASVAFALNVFLDHDTAECWNAFNRKTLPVLKERIAQLAGEMGFSEGWPPQVVAVSGRAPEGEGGCSFGAVEFASMIEALRETPRARSVRLSRIKSALDDMRGSVEQILNVRSAAVAEAASRNEGLIAVASKIESEADAAIDKITSLIPGRAEEVASQISRSCLKRDSTYTDALYEAVCEVSSSAARQMARKLEEASARCPVEIPRSKIRAVIEEQLEVDKVGIEVADNPVESFQAGRAAMAIGVSAALAFIFPIAPIIGGIAAAASTKSKDQRISEAVEKDIVETKDNIAAAAQGYVDDFETKRYSIGDEIKEAWLGDLLPQVAGVHETLQEEYVAAREALEVIDGLGDALESAVNNAS
jgi:GTPase SAR1 family protein